jgi:hypothetical protein
MKYHVYLMEADGTYTSFTWRDTLEQAVDWANRTGNTYYVSHAGLKVWEKNTGITITR